ncbi:MAG: lipid A biosynthesis acyltransferase [Gammaproteobacteria bacterium]|nr:lipid A biosynthesis acyltransferase [Gammaproteobacteria bacterium]
MSTDWQSRSEAGASFGLRLAAWIALTLGRPTLKFILYFIAFYFLLVRRSERQASRKFLARVTNKRVSILQVYKHFLTFAQVTADRIYFMVDRSDILPIHINGAENANRFVRQGRGCVMLGSHLGNMEAARDTARKDQGVDIRMVLDRAVSRELIKRLEAINPDFARCLIDAGQPAAQLGLSIGEALKQGDFVGFLGDRYRPGDRTVLCDFMGQPAKFPVGPLLIASVLRAPVVIVFSLYLKGAYEVICEPFSDAFHLPRDDREQALQESVQRYADRLALHAERAPYNWFNFYDFWAVD